jgi:hypothetical protein
VTATKKKEKPEKAEPKISGVPMNAAVKRKKAASTGPKPLTASLIVANRPSASPLDHISDLLDSLPLDAFVQLTRLYLNPLHPFPKGRLFLGPS